MNMRKNILKTPSSALQICIRPPSPIPKILSLESTPDGMQVLQPPAKALLLPLQPIFMILEANLEGYLQISNHG